MDPDQAPSFLSKIVSMIRKYHNHKPKTNPWHREEKPHNHHETSGRETKQSNQLSLQIQILLTFKAYVRPSVYSQIGHLLASFLFYAVSIWLNMTSTKWSPSQGFWETGEMTFIPGEHETKVKFWVGRGTKALLGNMAHKKQFSILGEQGNKPIYFRGTRERLSTRHIKLCL